MFARRHPYLFSVLVLVSVVSGTAVVLTLLASVTVAMLTADWGGIGNGEKVGVIEVTGMIADSRDLLAQFKRFRTDEEIRAIVVRIDSPGGGVGASQEIFREIRKTRAVKKVVASLGGVAASGGYYIAAGADGIMANPGTITGSIGVIMQFANFQDLLEKIGLRPVVVKAGQFKDIGSPVREMLPEEQRLLEALAGDIHRQFIEDVASGRGLAPEQVASLADGRIFTGRQSKRLGLIDRIGNMDDALQWAGRMAGIDGPVDAVYATGRPLGFLERLTGVSIEQVLLRLTDPRLSARAVYRPGG